ncbi:PLP-dependent aminotransferase family protein [Kribbella sp. NPDC056861]|uniref:MocR-like transcription factor YczR n=1 Tax=Kribbella sp. NPDC056861 TaxID=3154857 RepID=UPI003431F153
MKISAYGVAKMLSNWDDGPGPAHRRLSDRLTLLVLDGRLALGATVPSERELAATLGISRTTVGAAYGTLVRNNYLSTQERSRATVRLPAGQRVADPAERATTTADLSFAAPQAPGEILHSSFAAALEQLPRHFERHGYDRYGIAELRDAIASWYQRRGLATSRDQILVTNGAQHALALLARTLLAPRDRVVIEHPTYPHAITTLLDRKAVLVPVGMTSDGWDVAQLRAAARTAKLAFLIPDFQNPTGLLLSVDGRERLKLACPTIVDETLTDLWLDSPPPPPYAVHHPAAISIGSVSKSIWGGLRIGWIRATPALLERVNQQRPAIDLGTAVVEQLATANLLDNKLTHRTDAIDQLRLQRDTLQQALHDALPQLEVSTPTGGVSIWAAFPAAISSRLAATAPDHGLTLAAGPRFGIGGAFERHLRLPFTLPPDRLLDAVGKLARTVEAIAGGSVGTHRPLDIA